MPANVFHFTSCLLLLLIGLLLMGIVAESDASDFDNFLKPAFAQNCIKCHGEEEVNGEVNLKEITTPLQFLAQPELIEEMIEVVGAYDMPPEGEPELDEKLRAKLLASLKTMLREATTGNEEQRIPIRRLNRFQYNNSVKDLFRLNLDVFELPEKLMTRHGDYLNAGSTTMPDVVHVASHSLNPKAGMRNVKSFPKDLRASHGFDNQANQLTLSPLLLDAFLRLSVSILESPDFNEQNVGIWNDFFQEPAAGQDMEAEVKNRLGRFLRIAFRRPVDTETLDRYTAYAMTKINQGLSFADSMKKAVSAALSSPMFLYRPGSADGTEDQFELASNLSFFLWGSCPDWELLQLADRGELSLPEILNQTLDRMFADPKIERFLDTFPSQWMQLENILAATPDPNKYRLFSLDKEHPASLQMVLEPLLLFDAVFLEDRPIVELIAPKFSYQSEFLRDWYTSDLKPAPVDEAQIAAENRVRTEKRNSLEVDINTTRAELADLDKAMADPISANLVSIDPSPGQAEWEAAQAKLIAESVELSAWHRIGPFGAGSFDEAHAKPFFNETAVDLPETHENLTWEEATDFIDGKVHQLSGANSATYLYRTIQSGSARLLELSLGSDDSFKLWLNGQLVADKKVSRGVAPDQDKVQLELAAGENKLLMKVVNGGGDYGFYFKSQSVPLPESVVTALKVAADQRSAEQTETLARHYLAIAPELSPVRKELATQKAMVSNTLKQLEDDLNRAPKPQDLQQHRQEAQRRFDDQMRDKMRSQTFERVSVSDPRYGGVITSAAMLSMTSGPKRTHPIARGAWIIEVIFNDPPPPPPNDVPPLNEEQTSENLTIREKFAKHRENPDCAGCHSRLDPLGFALENFDVTGRWRDKYENGRDVDPSGTLMRKYVFDGIVNFKESLVKENRRFAKAFTGHLLRFAVSRELRPLDSLTIDTIVDKTEQENFKLKSLIKEVVQSDRFLHSK